MGWQLVSTAVLVVQVTGPGTSPFSGPADVLAAVRARGAKAVVAEVWTTDAWQAQVQPGVASADANWLEVAGALHPGTDAGSAEDLNEALAMALLRAPERVLPMLRELWWGSSDSDGCVFADDSELPGGVSEYVGRLAKSLRSRASLGHLDEQCLEGLKRTRSALRDPAAAGQERRIDLGDGIQLRLGGGDMGVLGIASAIAVVALGGGDQSEQSERWGPFDVKNLPFGCVVSHRPGIDSSLGSLHCGETTIQFDIGQMAGDLCSSGESVEVGIRGHSGPMTLCVLRNPAGPRSIALSIPRTYENYYVVDPRPEDVVVLIRVVRSLAEPPVLPAR